MKAFADVFDRLDASTSTDAKHAALVAYFREVEAADGAWALAVFCGRSIKRAASSKQMKRWAAEVSGLPAWLIDECHGQVGDLGETLSLIVPDAAADAGRQETPSLAAIFSEFLTPMTRADEAGKRAMLVGLWARLDQRERFVLHKLISTTFRVGVSRGLAVRAMATVAGVDQARMDHALSGQWPITAEYFQSLRILGMAGPRGSAGEAAAGGEPPSLQPYPFFLAQQLPDEVDRPDLLEEQLGPRSRWQVEWKWDGLRGQIVRRDRAAVWSRGGELLSRQFPELIDAAEGLPTGTVLDGEVLAFEGGRPLDFSHLQTRIARVQPTGLLFVDVPVVFMAYDLLEIEGRDLRGEALSTRRAMLEGLVAGLGHPLVRTSEVLGASSWAEVEAARGTSRARGVEGVMLKRVDSVYGAGRVKLGPVDAKALGAWWKWKIDPLVIDCVLVSAQRGSGRRASLYTDYTFALWSGPQRGEGELVPFAKAYHGKGMTDEVFVKIDQFIRGHTIGRIGGAGIRLVEPRLVFELAFEGVQASARHRSGLAVRFPRVNRWRTDKHASEADTLGTLRALVRS